MQELLKANGCHLYCFQKHYTSIILSQYTSSGITCLPASNWNTFCYMLSRSPCGIIEIDWLSDQDNVNKILSSQRMNSGTPHLLVIQRDIINMKPLAMLSSAHVVWLNELQTELLKATRHAIALGGLAEVAGLIARSPHLPAVLRRVLRHVLTAPVPVRSQTQLSEYLGVDRATIARQWSRTGSSVSLKQFIDSTLLIRAMFLKIPSRSWQRIADEIGMNRHTLEHISNRLLGMSLLQLTDTDRQILFLKFIQPVMEANDV